MSRIVYVSIGWICIVIGTIGTCVPLLPTVPLYLLAALCFAKGSRRVHAWFVSTKLYQDNLKSYVEGNGMTRKTKARIMLTITVQMAIGYAFMGHVPFGRVFMACVWVGLMIYFSFGVKTQSE